MGLSKGFGKFFEEDESSRDQQGERPFVLVVDDDPGVLESLEEQLEQTYHVVTASSAAEALEVLTDQDVTVILSDQRMPSTTGAELLEAARARRPDTVRLLITGYADLQAVIDAVNRGSIYYFLTKPWESGEVARIVAKAVEYGRLNRERRELIDELRAANQLLEQRVAARTRELEERNWQLEEANRRVEELARRDPLTGALNRRALDETLKLEAERCLRQALPVSAILLDIDHFKRINDECGHAVGDLVLKELARMLTNRVRPYDPVARYGGEEFVVTLPGTPLEQAVMVAERLRTQMAKIRVEGLSWNVTGSFGVAQLRTSDRIEDWLTRADGAMYEAKRSGRDRVVAEREAGDGTCR